MVSGVTNRDTENNTSSYGTVLFATSIEVLCRFGLTSTPFSMPSADARMCTERTLSRCQWGNRVVGEMARHDHCFLPPDLPSSSDEAVASSPAINEGHMLVY